MTRAAKEIRDQPLSVRTTPTLKRLAEQMAADQDRSLTWIVERLITEEAKRLGMITADTPKKK